MKPEEMLRQVCSNHFECFYFEELFVIDGSVPGAIVKSLHPFPALDSPGPSGPGFF